MNYQKYKSAICAYIIFGLICYADWYLFKSHVLREKSWSPFLNGDANWYLSQSYEVFHHLKNYGAMPGGVLSDPSGFMIFALSALLYFLFGASRLVALSTNFVFFPLFLFFIFIVIRRLSNSWLMALAGVGLSLSIGLPFQGDEVTPLHSIAAYQRDFAAFVLFGIFVLVVLYSNTFEKLKWGILAGIVAGLTVTFRYNLAFHFVGIYLMMIGLLLVIFLWLKKTRRDTSFYKIRLKNCTVSFLSLWAVIGYPLYYAWEHIYLRYFDNFWGEVNPAFLEIYGGLGDLAYKLSYYPRNMFYYGLGRYFHDTALHILALIVLLIISSYLIRYTTKTINDPPNTPKLTSDKEISVGLPFFLFLGVSLFAPLFILNMYEARAWNAATFLTAPSLIFVLVTLALVFKKFYSPDGLISRFIGLAIAIVAITEGGYFQIQNYSLASNSSHHRSSYTAVARLYDDIVTVSRELNTKRPRVSANFLENYSLGGAIGLTAYQYEKTGELFNPVPKLGGQDLLKEIDLSTAERALIDSDVVLFDVSGEIATSSSIVQCDPLQETLANYPIAKSLLSLQSDLLLILKDHFIRKANYTICGRNIGLYVNRNPSLEHTSASSTQTTWAGYINDEKTTLLIEGIHGFNVVEYNHFVYAIPQSEGAFDISRVRNNDYARIFQGPDVETVMNDIQKALPKLLDIKASSVSNLPYSFDSLVRESNRVWHSAGFPKYPQWLQFSYERPVVFKRVTIWCQIGGAQRAPRWFKIQGKRRLGGWTDLLKVENANFSDDEEVKSWVLENSKKYSTYRLLINSNNGAKDFVTIKNVYFSIEN